MENAIDIYYHPVSPPVRAVLMLAQALGVILNLKFVDLMEGEQLKPEFLKMNPMHTLPTMDDGGYILWESKAIMHYLSDKFDTAGKFKAMNTEHQGRINLMMYFDATTLFPRLTNYLVPVLKGQGPPSHQQLSHLQDGLKVFDTMLIGSKYAAGSRMTLADFALTSTISTIEAIKVDLRPYANIAAWYDLMKHEMPGFEDIDQKGAAMMGAAFAAKAA